MLNKNTLQHYSKDEQNFVKKISSIKSSCLHDNRVKLLDFLTPREQEIISAIIGERLQIIFYGGYDESERKRCLITPFEKNNHSIFKIDCLKISYDRKFGEIKHPNVLGTIISLGINRSSIGDIVVKDDIYIFVDQKVTRTIINELNKINNCSVHVEISEFTDSFIGSSIESKTVILSSFRVDNVISKAFNLSRNNSKEILKLKVLKVNHKLVTNPNYIIKHEDVISLRRYGRIKIIITEKLTKKNNHVVEMQYYK